MPSIGPRNPALGEIYQRLYPEMRRPKPNQEAIAAALQAMQRLTMEADSETAAEDATLEPSVNASNACRVCGHHNREGNKFCGMCGLPIGTEPTKSADQPLPHPANFCPRLRHPRWKPQTRFNRRPAPQPARIITTITIITTISREDTPPTPCRVSTLPRARGKRTA